MESESLLDTHIFHAVQAFARNRSGAYQFSLLSSVYVISLYDIAFLVFMADGFNNATALTRNENADDAFCRLFRKNADNLRLKHVRAYARSGQNAIAFSDCRT